MRDVSKNIVQIAFELEVKFEPSLTLTNKKKKITFRLDESMIKL